MRFAQETFEITQTAISRIDAAIIGNIIPIVAQRRGIERHDPYRGRAEVLNVIELLRQASKIADTIVVGVEKGFHMQLIDNRVAIPLQVIAINHAAGLLVRPLPDLAEGYQKGAPALDLLFSDRRLNREKPEKP